MSLNPITATKDIEKRYTEYLSTTFYINNSELQQAFLQELTQKNRFIKGPILEATPPFKKGKSINELISEGVLSEEFRKLNSSELPIGRELYLHQEMGIRKVISGGRNIIAATGTGSGKTEIFMIPILNYLFTQKENGKLSPGVRALLLYPMNALANDQLKRLRKLLCNYPKITFGSYTGETERYEKDALEKYRKMYKGEQPLENELISRERMQNSPPHILITNYAMLEYLLLRPDDNVFFDGPYAQDWKFIVLDEVHTYTGAKGIEMSMLLRRLKERILIDESQQLNFIGTSATIGRGEKDFKDVAKFGEKLFSEKVCWDDSSETEQDIIRGERLPIEICAESWGKPDTKLYSKWYEALETSSNSREIMQNLSEIAQKCQVPINIINDAKKSCENSDFHSFIYEILEGDGRIIDLQQSLKDGPCYINELAKMIFPNEEDSKQELVWLINLANRAFPKDGYQPLIPARYHLFVRSIEGAYLSLFPDKKLFLEKMESISINDKKYPVFEIATCRNCGALYLVGKTVSDREKHMKIFKQQSEMYLENDTTLEYYLLLKDNQECEFIDEDELVRGYKLDEGEEKFNLCSKCGAIDKENLVGKMCNCGKEYYVKLLKVNLKDDLIHKCPACGNTQPRGSIVWRFLLGADATASVLATSLYQQGAEPKTDNSKKEIHQENNGWGTLLSEPSYYTKNEVDAYKGNQLLVFSDSRQDAAFFATYLESSYLQILRRSMIIKTLKKHKEDVVANKWRVADLVNKLKNYLEETELFPEKSLQQLEDEAWKWVLYEFLAFNRRNSLEGLGLLGFSILAPKTSFGTPFLYEPWNLTFEESWTVFQVLLDGFRKNAAIVYPQNVSPTDEFFEPRNREYYFKEKRNKNDVNTFGWCPAQGLNSRLDFLMRLAENGLNRDISKEECSDMLKQIWEHGLHLDDPRSIFYNYFSSVHDSVSGTKYRMKTDYWELNPGIIDKTISWYYCPVCNRLTLYNVRNVCPTFKCPGKLQKCDPDIFFEKNHYRNLYLSLLPLRMNTSEHTAQLTTEAAAEIQQEFNAENIDVLSCSTTFELGVDVGELETVFLKNVPPSPANYIQRAGRAGRRRKSTAFILTFAQRRSHDLTYFNNPKKLIAGEIKPPYFELKNEKIIYRHIFSVALSKFWREHREYFNNVENFFVTNDGPETLDKYLSEHPMDLLASIKSVVPTYMHKHLEIDEWGWVEKLLDEENGLLSRVKTELLNDINQLEFMKDYYAGKNLFSKAEFMLKTINTLKKRNLINYLAQKNVLPKYGFPVDVVDLQIYHHGDKAKQLDLSRDMQIALSEYAPGSQVIAGGLLWTSRYLKKMPDRELIKRRYAICDYCGNYESELYDGTTQITTCSSCGNRIGKKKGVFVIPEFGFISENPKPPTMEKPRKTYTTRKYYARGGVEDTKLDFDFNGVQTNLISMANGRLAVINYAGRKEFRICSKCGNAVVNDNNVNFDHETAFGKKCNGPWERLALGFEFSTDILQIRFENYQRYDRGFWLSILYGILEGVSYSMEIERSDIDGCLYAYSGDPASPALVLFDNVPGGAGHVKRIIQENNFKEVLEATLQIVSQCNCGGKEGGTSCYGCLRNYSNQFCHDLLDRSKAKEFVEMLLTHEQ